MIFHNSGIDFWRQNPSKNHCEMTSKTAYLNSTHFGLKIRHKIPPRRSQDSRRLHDAPRGPKTLQDVPETAPGRLQDDPKTPPRRFKILLRRPQDGSKPPKTPQNASKTPQDVSKTPPRRLQTSISGDLWSIFGIFVMAFGLIFDPFFKDFCSLHLRHLLLSYMRSWRGGGDAALLRFWINLFKVKLCFNHLSSTSE